MNCKYESDEQNVVLGICLSVCLFCMEIISGILFDFVSGLQFERH